MPEGWLFAEGVVNRGLAGGNRTATQRGVCEGERWRSILTYAFLLVCATAHNTRPMLKAPGPNILKGGGESFAGTPNTTGVTTLF